MPSEIEALGNEFPHLAEFGEGGIIQRSRWLRCYERSLLTLRFAPRRSNEFESPKRRNE